MLNKFITKFLFIFLLSNLAPDLAFAENNNYLKFEASQFSKNNEIVVEVWNSKDGLERLNRSEKNDFYQLANFFQIQINPFYCGIASGTMVLNAINVPTIIKLENTDQVANEFLNGESTNYMRYSQDNFLNEKTDKIKDRKIIEFKNAADKEEFHNPGVSLDDLEKILKEVYNLKVESFHATNDTLKSIEKFRSLVKKTVNDSDHFMIVNLNNKSIGLKTGGHHSPLVAYDEKTDSVLIMEVGYKRPWYWVPLEHLYKAMNTKDGNKYRGYLVVSKR